MWCLKIQFLRCSGSPTCATANPNEKAEAISKQISQVDCSYLPFEELKMLFVLVCCNLKFLPWDRNVIYVYTFGVGLTSKTTRAGCNEMLFTLGIRWEFIIGKVIQLFFVLKLYLVSQNVSQSNPLTTHVQISEILLVSVVWARNPLLVLYCCLRNRKEDTEHMKRRQLVFQMEDRKSKHAGKWNELKKKKKVVTIALDRKKS